MLTQNQQQAYQRDGYLVLPDFFSPSSIALLCQRAADIVEEFDPGVLHPIFTTERGKQKSDAYFMQSADKIRCFFEAEAFNAEGELKQEKALSINKIGHALHDIDPVFFAFSHTPQLAALAQALDLQEPQIWQSMYIFKQPGIGGAVNWHQDASFFDTEPITVTTFWFALQDADLSNGCLWVQPGGHRGPLREKFVRIGECASMQQLDATPWPTLNEARALPVQAGSLVVFHGLLPHYSAANTSAISRHAYTLHVTDGRSRYSPHNWLQRRAELPVRGFV